MTPTYERLSSANRAAAYRLCATLAENILVVNECSEDGQWRSKPLVILVSTLAAMANDAMCGIGGGADWEQREDPNRTVQRRSALNRHQRRPLSSDTSCLRRSRVLAAGH